jgi:hypothetical protein
MQRRVLILFCFSFYLATDISHAAGLIYRIQQKNAMKQQSQEEYEQGYQQQQGQGGQPQGQPAAPAPPTYQQTVDQRNQAIAQAILNAHNQSVSSEYLQSSSTGPYNPASSATPSVAQQASAPMPGIPQGPEAVSSNSSTVVDVVDLSEVWKKLDKKSLVWALLIDDQAKMLTVSEYIDRFRNQGVKINASPAHYVQLIDQMAQDNPAMLQRPFGELIQILAIVDYDFDNGMDKDDLARHVLGEEGFEANKKRFSQQSSQ